MERISKKVSLELEAPTGFRWSPLEREIGRRFQDKYLARTFADAVRQMMQRVARDEGWL